jgi:hypothetical protein
MSAQATPAMDWKNRQPIKNLDCCPGKKRESALRVVAIG